MLPLLFVTAAAIDLPRCAELFVHLEGCKSEFTYFQDSFIPPGENRNAYRSQRLKEARAVAAVLSPDWLNEQSLSVEIKESLQRGVPVIPILLRPCIWDTSVFSSIQPVPQNGEFISSAQDREQVVYQVALSLRERLRAMSAAVPRPIEAREPIRRTTVWVIGSYNEIGPSELTIVHKVVARLGIGLALKGVRLVSGRSEMLTELSASYRGVSMMMEPLGPLPIFLDGMLRKRDLKRLFVETIGSLPDIAIVIGGGVSRGRVAEECQAAREAGIPLLPLGATGGAAAMVRPTAERAIDLHDVLATRSGVLDADVLVRTLLNAVERY